MESERKYCQIGLFDIAENFWYGDEDGKSPLIYDDLELADIASLILTLRFKHKLRRIYPIPFDKIYSGPIICIGILTPTLSFHQVIKSLLDKITNVE